MVNLMVTLKDRNEENAKVFWKYSKDAELNRLYPFEPYSLKEFLKNIINRIVQIPIDLENVSILKMSMSEMCGVMR